jgi:rSAM/selenodomain-associated transferase 1
VTTAVGIMARAPSAEGKTRLAPHLPDGRLRALRFALLSDTLAALHDLPDLFMFFTPDEADQEIASICGAGMPRVAQGGGDLGARMLAAIRHLLDVRGYDAAILVGSDIPWLSADHLHDAAATLETRGGIVLGPASDGGYYLIGMTAVRPEVFEQVAWGTDSVLTDTLRAAERSGVEARLVRSTYDVDTIDDLRRLARDLDASPADVCPYVRRWFSES